MRQCFTGFCPTLDEYVTIEVKYTPVSIVGKSKKDYKRISFICDYCDDYNCGLHNDCPIFNNAPLIQ